MSNTSPRKYSKNRRSLETTFRKTRGFTLIELLVVIAIIGLLATIVMVSLNSARAKARDTRIQSDFKQISLALAMYYDNRGTFPVASNWGANDGANWQVLVNALAPTYMSSVPQHPLFNGSYPWFGNAYHYYSLGASWVLLSKNETLGFQDQCGGYSGWCCGYWLIVCGK